ncbi:ATP-binding cassette domain-containing protein [Enterococcus hirae]
MLVVTITTHYLYEALIRLANLKEKEKCYLDQLSGGQKRRLTFATTMAGNPQLIFLDEPTAGMDSNSRQSFWESIDRLKQNGKTFLSLTIIWRN